MHGDPISVVVGGVTVSAPAAGQSTTVTTGGRTYTISTSSDGNTVTITQCPAAGAGGVRTPNPVTEPPVNPTGHVCPRDGGGRIIKHRCPNS